MVIPILLFLVGFALLIFGGDWFVDGAVAIAKKWHIPDLLIGATVVSIGTTLPEVMVSAGAAVAGHSEIAYGNALGSIICNTALISAITITFAPGLTDKKSLRVPAAFFFTALVIYAGVAYFLGFFSRAVGIALLVIFVVYIGLQVKSALGGSGSSDEELDSEEMPMWKAVVLLVLGAAAIAVGADLLVDNGTIIAQMVGVPESVIALTFVALGTSLPELITAITSLKKGHGALSLGNVVGANLFNLVLVSGLSMTLRPFAVPASKLLAGMNASLLVDIPVVFGVMLLMTVPALAKGKLYRWQGILLLVIYFGYCVFQFAF
ncbi:MAG: calcium/sodium antiporter [Clostridia bacterium]|nr:calcium/sodium antiporter [Clostridia bacterium]